MTAEQLAQQAASLKDNEAFQAALSAMRADALDRLATVNADDRLAIIANQAAVKVVDKLRGNLEQFIRSGQPAKPPGIA